MRYLRSSILVMAVTTTMLVCSCKGKDRSTSNNSDTTVTTATTDTTQTSAAVQVSPDDALATKAKDAVKDYPGVAASVSNGEVTLTGDVSRDMLPKVMQAINAIHPKKVNNKLTIK